MLMFFATSPRTKGGKLLKPETLFEREQALVDGDAFFPLLSGGLGVKVAFVIVGSCIGNIWAQSDLWTGGMALKWFFLEMKPKKEEKKL